MNLLIIAPPRQSCASTTTRKHKPRGHARAANARGNRTNTATVEAPSHEESGTRTAYEHGQRGIRPHQKAGQRHARARHTGRHLATPLEQLAQLANFSDLFVFVMSFAHNLPRRHAAGTRHTHQRKQQIPGAVVLFPVALSCERFHASPHPLQRQRWLKGCTRRGSSSSSTRRAGSSSTRRGRLGRTCARHTPRVHHSGHVTRALRCMWGSVHLQTTRGFCVAAAALHCTKHLTPNTLLCTTLFSSPQERARL